MQGRFARLANRYEGFAPLEYAADADERSSVIIFPWFSLT